MVDKCALNECNAFFCILAWFWREFPKDKNLIPVLGFLDVRHQTCVVLEVLPCPRPKTFSLPNVKRRDLIIEDASEHVNARNVVPVIQTFGDVDQGLLVTVEEVDWCLPLNF